MSARQYQPEDVFTPKGKKVNDEMYVSRKRLEDSLTRALRKPKHIVIHGESGTGKTWLYKKVFEDNNVYYQVLNAATIVTEGSVVSAINSLCSRISPVRKDGYQDTKKASVGIGSTGGGLTHQNNYSVQKSEVYLDLVQKMAEQAGLRRRFLVIENLEHVVKIKDFVRELTALLLYLDDDAYSQHDVRLLLVGTPTDLRDYFINASESQTIANRLSEIPEVSVLLPEKSRWLAHKGLIDLLKLKVQGHEGSQEDPEERFDEVSLIGGVSYFSINIPQYIHEICLEVALEAEERNGCIDSDCFYGSVKRWVDEALVSESTRVEGNLNSKETRFGRRNQVIYALSQMPENEFSLSEIEAAVRGHFPESTKGRSLNMSLITGELCSGSNPIVRKVPNSFRYRFVSPKAKIMARWMITKNPDESIVIDKFEQRISI